MGNQNKEISVVTGKITKGAGVVSGRANDSLYGATGTIRRQIPIFMSMARAMGNPMPSWFPNVYKGSLNVDIGNATFDILNPDWEFKNLTWMYMDKIHPKYKGKSMDELRKDPDINRIFTALGLDVNTMLEEEIITQLHLKSENFKMVRGMIITSNGNLYQCILYRPDPATKGSIFHGEHCFEVFAEEIPAEQVKEGALVEILMSKENVVFSE